MILISSIGLSFSEYLSPKKQLELGITIDEIQCKENRLLVIRDNGSPACISERTAEKIVEKKNWKIIKTVFDNNQILFDDDKEEDEIVSKHLEHTINSHHTINSSTPISKSVTDVNNLTNKEEYAQSTSREQHQNNIKSNIGLCINKKSNEILNSFDLSKEFHIGASWWTENYYRNVDSGTVCVIDPNMNLDPKFKDSFDVDVWSDSDDVGIKITVTETSVSSGLFGGTVPFTNQEQSSESALKVTKEDTITIRYVDNTLPDPYATTDEIDLIATSLISSNVPKYKIESDVDIIDELKKEYSVLLHGEEKTAVDYALSKKIQNEKNILVCDVDLVKPYNTSDYPDDLYFRQFTIRSHPPPEPLVMLYLDKNVNSRVIQQTHNIHYDHTQYNLNPTDYIPLCLPQGQEIKFITQTSFNDASTNESRDIVDIIIAPNTSEINPLQDPSNVSSKDTFGILYSQHGISLKIDTAPYLLDKEDFANRPHFMSNYGPVAFRENATSSERYCAFDEANKRVCTLGFGTFIPGSSMAFVADGKHISALTYRYNLETLIDIISSIENLNFKQTSSRMEPVKPKLDLKVYDGPFGNSLSSIPIWPVNWDSSDFNPLSRLPQYVPDGLELRAVHHSDDLNNDRKLEQKTLWYSSTKPYQLTKESIIDNGFSIIITDNIEYDEQLITKFADKKNLMLNPFNGYMSISIDSENGSYLLFYDKQSQIELYSKKYDLDELTKIAESLIEKK